MAPDAPGPEQVVFFIAAWTHTESFENDASLGLAVRVNDPMGSEYWARSTRLQ